MKYHLSKKNKAKIAHFEYFQFGLFCLFYKKIFFYFFIFIFFISTASCTGSYDEAEEKKLIDELNLGNFSQVINPTGSLLAKLNNTDAGSLYYIGLYLKKDINTRGSAKKFFEYATKYSKIPYNKLARDELYLLSSSDEKLNIINDIISDENISFENKDKFYEKQKRLFLILKKFDKIDIPIDEYLAGIKFDSELNIFLEKFLKQENNNVIEKIEKKNKGFKQITKARILVSKKKYGKAWEIFSHLLENNEKYPYIENRKILSDMGRAATYDAKDYTEKALLFEKVLRETEKASFEIDFKKHQKYMYAFYSARLNLKAKTAENTNKAINLFKHSLNYATSKSEFDNSLWYYLNTLKENSFDSFFDELCTSSKDWKDDFFYEDLVPYTIMQLLKKKDIKRFKQFAAAIEKTDLREAQARNAYILARLDAIHENELSKEEKNQLYSNICNRKHNFAYYRILANYWRYGANTDFSNAKIFTYTPYAKNSKREKNRFPEKQCLKILSGLNKYKLYGEIYQHIYSIYPRLPIEHAEKFSKILAKHKNYSDSMKLMRFAVKANNAEVNRAQLTLIYPRPFLKEVKKYAKEFNVPEYLMYGLMRSESFFKTKVVSHAGAIGLTQLMKPTAKDIARRLRIKNYNIEDPDTNIKFGTYYISRMIISKNENIMAALFSYNAGPNAVRRWQQQFKEFPNDLFLELLPYNETRSYGRHVFTATTIYAELYYGKKYSEVVEDFFKF